MATKRLDARLAALERQALPPYARLVADVESGRRRIQDLTDAELESIVSCDGTDPAGAAWLRSLPDAALKAIAAGEPPARFGYNVT